MQTLKDLLEKSFNSKVVDRGGQRIRAVEARQAKIDYKEEQEAINKEA